MLNTSRVHQVKEKKMWTGNYIYNITRDGYSLIVLIQWIHTKNVGNTVLDIYAGNIGNLH